MWELGKQETSPCSSMVQASCTELLLSLPEAETKAPLFSSKSICLINKYLPKHLEHAESKVSVTWMRHYSCLVFVRNFSAITFLQHESSSLGRACSHSLCITDGFSSLEN